MSRATPTTPTKPGPGVAIAVRLTHAGKPHVKGEWILQVGEDRLWLLDPSGNARAELSSEEAAASIRFPGHYSSVTHLSLPCDGQSTRFEVAGPGMEHIEAFIRKGMVAAGPDARRTVLKRSIRYLAVGVLSAGVGGVVTVLSLSHPSNSGRSTVLIGAIIVGLYEIYRGIAGLFEYARLNRAAAMIRAVAVSPRAMPRQPLAVPRPAVASQPSPRSTPPPVQRVAPAAIPQAGATMRPQPSSAAKPVSVRPAVVVPAAAKPISRAEARFTKVIMITLGVLLASLLIGGIWIVLTLPPNYSRPGGAPPAAPPPVAAGTPGPAGVSSPPSFDAHPPLAAETQPKSRKPPKALNDAPAVPASEARATTTEIVLSGDIEWADNVRSLKPGNLVSSTKVRMIRERQKYALPAPLQCDTTSTGTWADSLRRATARSVPAGAVINSFMVHVNIPGSGVVNLSGAVTFPTLILGIIASNGRLDASDSVVGSAAIAYPTGGEFRQWFDGDKGDFITVSADRHSLSVRSHTGKWVDQIRVITAAEP